MRCPVLLRDVAVTFGRELVFPALHTREAEPAVGGGHGGDLAVVMLRRGYGYAGARHGFSGHAVHHHAADTVELRRAAGRHRQKKNSQPHGALPHCSVRVTRSLSETRTSWPSRPAARKAAASAYSIS